MIRESRKTHMPHSGGMPEAGSLLYSAAPAGFLWPGPSGCGTGPGTGEEQVVNDSGLMGRLYNGKHNSPIR